MAYVNSLTLASKSSDLPPRMATSPHVLTPKPTHILADDDALVLEALRIAQGELVRQSRDVERVWPGTELAERLALFAEKMSDLRDRLDGRETIDVEGK